MCATSSSADLKYHNMSHEDLVAPYEKAEKANPRFYELLMMDDASFRDELVSGFEDADFRAFEEVYTTLLKDLNALGQYRYDITPPHQQFRSKVQEIFERFGHLNTLGGPAHEPYLEAVRKDPLRWLSTLVSPYSPSHLCLDEKRRRITRIILVMKKNR